MSQQYTAEQQQGRVRRVIIWMGIIIILLVVVCGFVVFLIRDSFDERSEPRAVLDGADVHSLVELNDEDAYPKAITVGADGNLYVSGYCSGKIWQITPEGDLTTWYDGAQIGAASGIAFTANGDLYVADRGDCDPRNGTASLKRISADGQTVETIAGVGRDDLPNFMTVDKTDTVFFTDNQNGAIYSIDAEGTMQTWWDMPETDDQEPLPTGIAYDAITDTLLIAETNSGSIFRVQFDSNRQPLMPQETIYQNDDRELDGLTLDEAGNVVVTLINVHKVARIMDGTAIIIAEDFRQPSDVVYLNNALYVTNFDGVSLAPIISFFVSPSLPFTVDVVELPELPTLEAEATPE